ncbi:hypothetical protein KNSL1_009282 [Colletotrichum chrysophilum]|nr:hypothetical protein KNSL1_009282 [Colletotrichum chrysophilum]
MKALVTNRTIVTRVFNLSTGKSVFKGAHVTETSKPTINDHEILVKVHTVALNPSDFKHIDVISPKGSRSVSDEEAATYGVSAVTAVLAVNVHLGLPWPGEPGTGPQSLAFKSTNKPIFIYAGSTSVGLFAIQLSKLAGYTVVTTASPHSYELVKRYGADHVFNYRSDTWIQEVDTAFPDISMAFDCFSEGGSGPAIANVIKSQGGKIVTLLDQGESKVPGVKYDMIMLSTVFGREFAWLPPIGPKFLINIEHRQALARFYAILPQIQTSLNPPPIKVVDGGIEVLLESLDLLRQGKVSGSKLVVKF